MASTQEIDMSRIEKTITVDASIDTVYAAGVTHAHVHQIGPDQGAFLEMAREELLPRLRDA
ncbi:MAG: hypothetical protein LH650_12100 [Chloroflexi bacterium]|nr:hypothetical protein [Chloroflexota bacterium]